MTLVAFVVEKLRADGTVEEVENANAAFAAEKTRADIAVEELKNVRAAFAKETRANAVAEEVDETPAPFCCG